MVEVLKFHQHHLSMIVAVKEKDFHVDIVHDDASDFDDDDELMGCINLQNKKKETKRINRLSKIMHE
jgi:hypothetical protein